MTTAAEPAWQNIPAKIQMVVRRLIEVARPKKVSLFGSYVRGDATRDSDLDVVVVASREVEGERPATQFSQSHHPAEYAKPCASLLKAPRFKEPKITSRQMRMTSKKRKRDIARIVPRSELTGGRR